MTLTLNRLTKTAAAVVTGTLSWTLLINVFVPKAQALTLLDNLSAPVDQSYPINASDLQGVTFFSQNDGLIRDLTSITLKLQFNSGSANGTNNQFFIDLYQAGANNLPTGTATTIVNTALTPTAFLGGIANYTFDLTLSGISILPNTRYSLVFRGLSGSSWSIMANCPTGGGCPGVQPYTGLGTETFNLASNSGFGGLTTQSSNRILQITLADDGTPVIPFDFSAAPGLLILGGIWGVTKLRKKFTKVDATDFSSDDQN